LQHNPGSIGAGKLRKRILRRRPVIAQVIKRQRSMKKLDQKP
jgi:hypothetical protein